MNKNGITMTDNGAISERFVLNVYNFFSSHLGWKTLGRRDLATWQ